MINLCQFQQLILSISILSIMLLLIYLYNWSETGLFNNYSLLTNFYFHTRKCEGLGSSSTVRAREGCAKSKGFHVSKYGSRNQLINSLLYDIIILLTNAGINLTGYQSPPSQADCRATNFFRQNPHPRDSFSVQNSGPRAKKTK